MTEPNTNTPIHITDAEFSNTVADNDRVLVDFWAPWCGPCRAIGPVLEDLAAAYGDTVTIAKIDVDEHQQMASAFGVQSIPTLVLFKDGQPVKRMIGLQSRQDLAAALDAVA